MTSDIKQKSVVERIYRASPETLWRLWTTKEGFESWWGPVGFRADVDELDGRLNGQLHYNMIADTPEMVEVMKQMGRPRSHEAHGWFSEFQPYSRLALTHVVDFLPGVSPYENRMTVEFFPAGESTRMVVTQDPMHDDEFTRMSNLGFANQLTKLDQRFLP